MLLPLRFLRFFFKIQKVVTFYVFCRVSHAFSNYGLRCGGREGQYRDVPVILMSGELGLRMGETDRWYWNDVDSVWLHCIDSVDTDNVTLTQSSYYRVILKQSAIWMNVEHSTINCIKQCQTENMSSWCIVKLPVSHIVCYIRGCPDW